MKHVKLFEAFLNESYYSTTDLAKLKEFAEEISMEIRQDYADAFDKKSSDLDEENYTPEEMLNYIKMWGEDNEMTADEVIKEFVWGELTQELGLENPPGSY